MRGLAAWAKREEGSALLEFAIVLPLLVVFVVGIYDFSGAFTQKQKIAQAAQEGAVVAAAQPTSDIYTGNLNPDSLQPVVTVIFNSLATANVMPLQNQGACKVPVVGAPGANPLQWSYIISGCPNDLRITIDRGWVVPGGATTKTVGTAVTVSYPYIWKFNSVIQLLVPGATYAPSTPLEETSTVHNQM